MSIKKLDRYLIEEADYCDGDDVTELEATNAELAKALEEIKRHLLEANPHCGRIYLFGRISNAFDIADKALSTARGDSHE